MRCARGEPGGKRELRFSAKLDRLDTEGEGLSEDDSLRGVGSGVVVVDEMALVLMACGLMTGEGLVGLLDEPGREDADAFAEECEFGWAMMGGV